MILEPLFVSFALEYNKKQELKRLLLIIVQENKTFSHNSRYQAEIFSLHDLIYLL